MTIDEAIEYAKEQQEIFGGKHKEFLTNVAEWLEEFKNIIQWKSDVMEGFCKYDASSFEEIVVNARAKAIDEFAEKLSLEVSESIIWDMLATMSKNSSLSDTSDKIVDYVINTANEIAERLKAGGKNE